MQKAWSIIIVPLALILTALMATVSVLVSFVPGGKPWQFACSRAWARGLLALGGIRVRVHGLERISSGRSYVFVANHQSYSDIWSLLAVLPLEFCFVAKESLFHWPFIGWHLRRSGMISIDRRGMKETYRALLAAAEKIRQGTSVVIFAEGTRSIAGEIGPFKRGSLLVAIKAGVPIVPIAINGSRACLPKGSCLIRAGVIDMVIVDPISVADNGRADERQLTEMVRGAIVKHYVNQ
ncbi:MAG: 1-acyl-sn-glycerol-3-phosphate acyltransferase [Acidobacteria bacterium]|nr:1-acyl-sn-glycerol-3-phosphate acyltransferase [Acidobacteriota bacterium]MBI3655795.1 1-acyl-sn-glycerol-3-phosphate acyltransferase [Acidobacteriota bacterium]